ncbi:MAG TPA: hypothetical protein VMU51_00770 [Mycobacteriales bacterium]|nr:hypothetical protein [Mycobacteriales bacterium]
MESSDVDRSRRQVLKLSGAALGLAGAAAAGLNVVGTRSAQAHGTIVSHSEIANQPTVYYDEVNPARRSSFGYNPTFYSQLETWVQFWINNTPVGWTPEMEIWSLGAHFDRGSAAHDAGRGFDLSRLRPHVNGVWTWGFETFNIWDNRTGSALITARKRYFATAASLHYHFRNVLTYLYNSDHHSHIHIDNLYYGTPGAARFVTSSEAQVQHLQACLNYVWGYPTSIDGVWGPQTANNSTTLIRRLGGSGTLLQHPDANWRGINHATMRFGYGTQNY